MEKKANHQANIVTVRELLPHNNADTLEIIPLQEYQVVVKKGQFKIGDLAVYIQPDSIVPQTESFRFIYQPYLDSRTNDPSFCKHVDPFGNNCIISHQLPDGSLYEMCGQCLLTDPRHPVVPEKKRRITVRKFRGEWSEGLLLPVTDFDELVDSTLTRRFVESDFPEGTDVSAVLNITHYDPDAGKESTQGECCSAPKLRKKYPTTLKGWYRFLLRKLYGLFRSGPLDGQSENISLGIPTYDVDAFKNYPNVFTEDDSVYVTEKIHGSNARYIFLDGIMYAGSRNLWKSPDSTCIFRKVLQHQPWVENWCRAHEGYVLWGEVTPTQAGYEYGSKSPQFFVFDIRTPDGKWVDSSTADNQELLDSLISYGCKTVPVLYTGKFNLEHIKTLVDGPSQVIGAKNIREGLVIKTDPVRHVRGVGRAQLKVVSNAFLEKDNK